MRGFPLRQMLLTALLFALAGFPVWRLTRPPAAAGLGNAPSRVAGRPPALGGPMTISLHFVPAPAKFAVTYLGKAVLTGEGPGTDFSGPWSAQVPAEGADLALQAEWPRASGDPSKEQEAAVRLRIAYPDGSATDQTFWEPPGAPMVEVATIKPPATASNP